VTEIEKHRISKLRAAQEQIDTAIAIRADGGSVVAVHTLAYAAQEVTEHLCALHNTKGARQQMLDLMKAAGPEKYSEVFAALRKDGNFFKHADRDPLEIIDFDERASDFTLFGAITNLERLGHQLSLHQVGFMVWLRTSNPEMLDMTAIDKAGLREDLEGWTTEIAKLPRPGRLVMLKILIFLVAGNQAAADPLIEKLRRSYPAFSM
jgi:hypothetical protein